MEWQLSASPLSRRAMLGATAVLATGPALAEECRLGPAPHEKGARVFMDMDQQELDASYDQLAYEPLLSQIMKRLASNSEAMRARIGAPERESYGPSAVEGLDIYRTKRENAPIFVFIHGGAWLGGAAKDYGYPAEMFVLLMLARITLRLISSRSRRPAAILASWQSRCAAPCRPTRRHPSQHRSCLKGPFSKTPKPKSSPRRPPRPRYRLKVPNPRPRKLQCLRHPLTCPSLANARKSSRRTR
jgi:hypothetical protein